jgi:hypothetical protein
VYQVNNSVTFGRKSIRSEEFLNQMVEVLGKNRIPILNKTDVKRK